VTVSRTADGTIALEGPCPVEDAELLLRLLQETPDAAVDWTHCGRLHTAVVQVMLAARPADLGACGDVWLGNWLSPKGL
jgi:hypothetical protein